MLNLEKLRRNEKAIWAVTALLTIIIDGCLFPIVNINPARPTAFHDLYRVFLVLMVINYHTNMGALEAERFSMIPPGIIAASNLAIITAGLVFRYLLEYGEVSNTYNFTVPNVIIHVAVLFGATMISYQSKHRKRNGSADQV